MAFPSHKVCPFPQGQHPCQSHPSASWTAVTVQNKYDKTEWRSAGWFISFLLPGTALQSKSLSQNRSTFSPRCLTSNTCFITHPTTILLFDNEEIMSKSKPFSGIYAGSRATFDLYAEDEKVRLHKGASRRYLLIVMTHAKPQRERNIFNTSNFCAAATIPGTSDGLSAVRLGQSFTGWKWPHLNLITFHCF